MPPKPVVAELMTPDPTVLSPDDSISAVREELALSGIRHLPVLDAQGRLAGIVSQRDVLAAGAARGGRPVREIMTEAVLTVRPETPAHEAAYLLLREVIGCLPVVNNEGLLVGIVTETDFLRVAHRLLGGEVPPDELAREEREADRV